MDKIKQIWAQLITPFKQSFSRLSDREKWLVCIAFVLLLGVALFYIVREPLAMKIEQAQEQKENSKSMIAWMDENQADLTRLASQKIENNNVQIDRTKPIAAIIEALPDSVRIKSYVDRVVPESDTNVRVWFIDVPFSELLAWIDALQDVGIDVSAMLFDKPDKDDQEQTFKENHVNGNITLIKINTGTSQ